MNEGKNKYKINRGNKCVRCGRSTKEKYLGNCICDDEECKDELSLAISLLKAGEMDEFNSLIKKWYQPVKLQEKNI